MIKNPVGELPAIIAPQSTAPFLSFFFFFAAARYVCASVRPRYKYPSFPNFDLPGVTGAKKGGGRMKDEAPLSTILSRFIIDKCFCECERRGQSGRTALSPPFPPGET